MPLPEKFSEFEHLQDVLRKVVNELVRESFRDDIEDLDINTPESALKYACMHKDLDTGNMTVMRMLLFTLIRGEIDIFDKLYSVPVLDHHRDVRFAPQIIFKFKEKKESAKAAHRQKNPVRMRTSFRLPHVPEKTITEAQINQWRNKVKTEFPATFYHPVSPDLYIYNDLSKQLPFNIRSQSKLDAIQLIEKLLQFIEFIREHSGSLDNEPFHYNAKWLKKHTDEVKVTTETVNLTGLNETYKITKGFTGVHVYLYRVELHIHGRLKNEVLLARYV